MAKKRSKKFLPEVQNQIYDLRDLLVLSHAECGGKGYVPGPYEGSVYRCDCMIQFRYLKELIKARLPKSPYWTLRFDELKIDSDAKTDIRKYLKNIERAKDNGLGLIFYGQNGTGKTSSMVEIGKEAIVRGFNVRYFTLDTYITAVLKNNRTLVEDLEFGDFLLVDEIDKVENDKLVSMIEEFLRRMSNAGKSMILSSNWEYGEFAERMKQSTESLLRRNNLFIEMPGEDSTDEIEESFFERLTEDYDYWHKNITLMAWRMEKEAFHGDSE